MFKNREAAMIDLIRSVYNNLRVRVSRRDGTFTASSGRYVFDLDADFDCTVTVDGTCLGTYPCRDKDDVDNILSMLVPQD